MVQPSNIGIGILNPRPRIVTWAEVDAFVAAHKDDTSPEMVEGLRIIKGLHDRCKEWNRKVTAALLGDLSSMALSPDVAVTLIKKFKELAERADR